MSPPRTAREALARGPAVWALSLSMMLAYSTLYYHYAGLVLFWMRETGWSGSLLAAGPMLSMLLAAALAPVIGRQVDRGRGPELLLAGPVLGAVALVALSFVQEPWQWIACWLLIGCAQAACFYEVCFAFLIRRLGPDAREAIIRVTLVAGLASTLSFPVYGLIGNGPGWRMGLIFTALLTVLVVVPLNFYATRKIRRETPPPTAARPEAGELPPAAPAASWRQMLLLILLSAGISLNHWMLATYIVPILVLRGYSEAVAITLAACLGPAQIAARIGLMWLGARCSSGDALRVLLWVMLLGSAALVAASAGFVFGLLFVLFQGAAFGGMTILRPMLISEVMGPENYGTNAGKILMPMLCASAVAPMIAALTLDHAGFGALVALSALSLVMSLVCLHKLQPRLARG